MVSRLQGASSLEQLVTQCLQQQKEVKSKIAVYRFWYWLLGETMKESNVNRFEDKQGNLIRLTPYGVKITRLESRKKQNPLWRSS